jgi:predicted small lipoprotein YifL
MKICWVILMLFALSSCGLKKPLEDATTEMNIPDSGGESGNSSCGCSN